MTLPFNYKMISSAREMRGLSQKELADRVSVLNQGNLSRIERGLLKASSNVIEQIAKALDFPVKYFSQTELKSTLNEIYYRKKRTTPKGELKKFEAKRDLIVKVVDSLMEGIEMPTLRLPLIDLGDGFTPIIAARKLREYFRIPKGPVKNLVSLIEKEGIIIQFIEAPEKIEGCTMISDNGVPIIFVNDNHPPDKKRFTIIHELGHIVMHLYHLVPVFRDVEKEVNAFTGEFLMPERDCTFDLKYLTFSMLPDLKSYWGTSYATIIRRAWDLGRISEKKKKSLYIQRSQLGYIKSEPNCGLTVSKPKLMKHLCNFYITNLEYSKQELYDMLCINAEIFETLVLNKKTSVKLKAVKPKLQKSQIDPKDIDKKGSSGNYSLFG